MPKVFITRRIPEQGIDLLRRHAEVAINPDDRNLAPAGLRRAVAGQDAVVCLLTDPVDQSVLAASAPRCKVFATMAVGYNNIDLAAARRLGIRVTNTPGVLDDATADLAWALLFAAARRVGESERFVRAGRWNGWGPLQFVGRDITGQTLGVVGAGRIGSNFARKSVGFRMRVLYCHPRPNPELEAATGAQQVGLEELLQQSDFVSLHVPLTPKTRHLIGARELARMRAHAVLVNTSRGPVVDEAALVGALREGTIAAAGLDVFEDEPRFAPGLLDLDNVVAVPHIGSATETTRSKMSVMVAENVIAVLTGREPPNPVV